MQNVTFSTTTNPIKVDQILTQSSCTDWQHCCSTICEESFCSLHKRGPVYGFWIKNFKDEKEKFTCFPMPHMKSPQAAQNTGSLKAYSYKSIKTVLQTKNTFATNLCPLTGWNFWAAWPLFILIAGSSPQEESKRTSSPFGFIGCRSSPSLSTILMLSSLSLHDLSELKSCLSSPRKWQMLDCSDDFG